MLHFRNLNGARITPITVFDSIKYRRRFREFVLMVATEQIQTNKLNLAFRLNFCLKKLNKTN